MKITLINPPWYHFEKSQLFSFNLGIGYLSSYLKSKNHQVCVIDALFGKESKTAIKVKLKYQTVYCIGKPYKQIIKEIPKDSDFIGLHAPFNNHATIIEDLSKAIKKKLPKIPIIVGGPYASACPKRALSEAVDYVIIGEGEIPLEKLLSGGKPEGIRGFGFKQNNRMIENGMAECITNLDLIPFPDREVLHYKEILSSLEKPKVRKGTEIIEIEERGFPILTSRGCPYDCHFCSIHHINGYKWRFRSPENVLKEIKETVQKYDLNAITFQDDMLTADIQRFNKILDGLLALKKGMMPNLSWSCPNGIRVDHLNEEIIQKIKESGCTSLVLGVQSGDPDMLQIMNTKLDLSKVEETVRLCKKYNIPTAGFLVFGYPGESRASFFKTLKYARGLYKAGMEEFRINIARAYLNTKMYELCKEKNYFIVKDIENLIIFPGTESEANIRTPEFDPKELIWRRDFAQRHLMSYENKIYWKTVYFLEMLNLKEKLKYLLPQKHWFSLKRAFFKLSQRLKF